MCVARSRGVVSLVGAGGCPSHLTEQGCGGGGDCKLPSVSFLCL